MDRITAAILSTDAEGCDVIHDVCRSTYKPQYGRVNKVKKVTFSLRGLKRD